MRFLCGKHHFQISSRVSSGGSIKIWDANFLATVASEGGPTQNDSMFLQKKVPPNKNTLHNTFIF